MEVLGACDIQNNKIIVVNVDYLRGYDWGIFKNLLLGCKK